MPMSDIRRRKLGKNQGRKHVYDASMQLLGK
jgi:hypothetical protein